MLINYQDFKPRLEDGVFVANGAFVVGDVEIKSNSSVWFNVVLRADVAGIRVGKNTNIQDNSTVHVARALKDKNGKELSPKIDCIIGDDVTIGHNCVIHACNISNNVLVGMGSVIMDGAIIGENSIIAANSLVTKNKHFPANSLIQGSPAKLIRSLSEEEIKSIKEQALEYVKLSKEYLNK